MVWRLAFSSQGRYKKAQGSTAPPMGKAVACVCLLLSLLAVQLTAIEPLKNDTILKLVKAGIGDDVVVTIINQQPGKYDLTPDAVMELKNAGLSDKLIIAMTARNASANSTAAPDVNANGITANPATGNDQPVSASDGDGVTRVYVTDSPSWEVLGGWGSGERTNASQNGSRDGIGPDAGGPRPPTAEMIEAFNRRCPQITVTNNRDKANFVVTVDRIGGTASLRRRNKIVVFNRNGDDIFSGSTRELGNSVKDACRTILNHASRMPNAGDVFVSSPVIVPVPVVQAPAPLAVGDTGLIEITFVSTPGNVLVSLNGMAVGRSEE